MPAEVKFTMPIPTLDALRRIVRRDFEHDATISRMQMDLPEKERNTVILRELIRREGERELIERTLGFDGTRDEIGRQP